MQTNITILSFRSGLFLFILSSLTMLAKGGPFILILTHFAPGLVYGFVLAAFYETTIATWKQLVFIALSIIIHSFCAFQVDVMNDDNKAPLRLIVYGSLGSLLLKLCYDLLILRKLSFFYSVLFPIILGLAGSLLSAGCMYLVITYSLRNEVISSLLWMGMFFIFPIWQYLFGLNIQMENNATANTSFVK